MFKLMLQLGSFVVAFACLIVHKAAPLFASGPNTL
jgi:hypothetical protein